MTRNITYECNLCRMRIGHGYGINWTGPDGGNKLNLVYADSGARQLEHHLCSRCVKDIFNEVTTKGLKEGIPF